MCPLIIPVTFPPSKKYVPVDLAKPETISNIIEDAFSLDSPSSLVSWGASGSRADSKLSPARTTGPGSAQGVAVGCQDGSIYVFHSVRLPTHQKRSSSGSFAALQLERSRISRPTSPFRHPGLSSFSSRSASPSSVSRGNVAPFQVSRSRVISALSTEQVEAPKNYVDYDDEPQKLKGMLKGKSIQNKTISEALSPNIDKSPVHTPPGRPSSNLEDDSRMHISTTNSAAPSIQSLSSPPSPTLPTSTDRSSLLVLKSHIFPARVGFSHAVSALKVLDGGLCLLSLQETGDVSIFSTADGFCSASINVIHESSDASSIVKNPKPSAVMWVWKTLHVAQSGEHTVIAVCASPDDSMPSSQTIDAADGDTDDRSRVVMLELQNGSEADPVGKNLRKVGDWCIEGPIEGLCLRQESDSTLALLHITPSRHLIIQALQFAYSPMYSKAGTPDSKANSTTALPLTNPFKAFKVLSGDHIPDAEKEPTLDIMQLGGEVDVGDVTLTGPILGLRMLSSGYALRGIIWSDQEISAFELHENSTRNLFTASLSEITTVHWIDDTSCLIVFANRAELYELIEVDADNMEVPKDTLSHRLTHPHLQYSITLPQYDNCIVSASGQILITRTKNGYRRLEQFDTANGKRSLILWRANQDGAQLQDIRPYLTSIFPFDLEHIVLGYSDGRISYSTLSKLTHRQGEYSEAGMSDISLPGYVRSLHAVENGRSKERYICGGIDDGSVAFWCRKSLKLRARWTIFTTPLTQIIQPGVEHVGHLRGCVLCISQDGTIAIIALDDFQFLYLVPGSAAPLQRVCLGEDSLLLIYRDDRARLWDIKTREFWRSMSIEKVDELLKHGGWEAWEIGTSNTASQVPLASFRDDIYGPNHGSTLLLNAETILQYINHVNGTLTGEKSSVANVDTNVSIKLEHIRSFLSAQLTFGLNDEIDRMCREKLGVKPSYTTSGLMSALAVSAYNTRTPRDPWCISPRVSATRALVIVSLLQSYMQHEGKACLNSRISDANQPTDVSQVVNTVILFYATSLGEAVGMSYQSPSLTVLAQTWLQSSATDLRVAARLLFESGVARLSDEEIMHLVESWQHNLSTSPLNGEKESLRSALSLFLCGSVAVDKYSLMSASVLSDIAKSIGIYLQDEGSRYCILAIDLCSRGFRVWQQYVDAVEMLRALFTLATTSRKEAVSTQNVGSQARTAVLQIASTNTPLFMTTLSIDILQPRSMQHRRAVMQLVIFLIRKKPLVLYSNLPRLLEAVVKSLDPNSTANRDAVLDSATEILGHVVRTFPTVDFHGASQRLAVGTSEGAVVMYDLKTATRLYVLEGHKKRTTACSFSPDGRRLVTVSLEESVVLVWKVGSSFTSFFTPGLPPRQGHSGSEPYKTLSFNVGEEADMTVVATLEHVKFEWASERSVKLMIRDSILTFST